MEVKDWLGEENQLGIDIWEKKYRNSEETFEDWLDRISNFNYDVRELIVAKKFLFGGRILANRGLGGKRTMSNCFTPETKVKTIDGYKPISEIKQGELVQTIDGSYQIVNATMVREYIGDIYTYNSPCLMGPIKCTPNHTFFTDNGDWVDMENIYKTVNHPKKKNYKLASLTPNNNIHEPAMVFDLYNQEFIPEEDGLLFLPIKKNEFTIEPYNGLVYNLSVEGNHTYIVEGLIAHNCYVLDRPEDNLESIFDTARKLARTFSYGGGVGIDIGKLAPRGAKVNNTAKESSGAVSFMELYDTTTGLIGQGGRRKI